MTWNTGTAVGKIRAAVGRGVMAAVETIRTEALDSIYNGKKTGNVYRRRGVVHQASAPGEAPAIDTGTLVSRSRTEYSADGTVGRLIFSTEYAPRLEFGTETLKPRPFLRPAVAAKREEVSKLIDAEIKVVLT